MNIDGLERKGAARVACAAARSKERPQYRPAQRAVWKQFSAARMYAPNSARFGANGGAVQGVGNCPRRFGIRTRDDGHPVAGSAEQADTDQ
jgi:hypothetical protein